MADPPLELGAVKAMLALALPAVAAPMVGTPGTVAPSALKVRPVNAEKPTKVKTFFNTDAFIFIKINKINGTYCHYIYYIYFKFVNFPHLTRGQRLKWTSPFEEDDGRHGRFLAIQSLQLPMPGSNRGYTPDQLIEQIMISICCKTNCFASSDTWLTICRLTLRLCSYIDPLLCTLSPVDSEGVIG